MMNKFDESQKKSDRPRKKRFYNTLRGQIEFYFSDVNLSKDRFFGGLLQESPYIDIEYILKCNKIKKLTTDPKDIIKALKKSSLLSVSEDGTKVFRTVPVAPVTNADDSTIYVEDLPLEVDHDWLKNAFSKYGDVVYVSIPHYHVSHKIKGFAFIQFDCPESANKALDAFRSANSCLSSSMAPGQLRSIQTYEGEKDVVERPKSCVINVDEIQCIAADDQIVSKSDEDEPQRKKRKKDTKEENVRKNVNRAGAPEAKNENAEHQTETLKAAKMDFDIAEEGSAEKTDSESEKSKNDDTNDNQLVLEEKHARKRKRKKAKKTEQVQTYGMQILSKLDWKKLRNKYLEEQRRRMHEVKQQLKLVRLNQGEKLKSEESETEGVEMQTEETVTSEARVKFTPGVIVKLQLDQPVGNVKYFKNEVKRYADVEYIDVVENSTLAYFRCSSNEAANQVIALNKWPNMTVIHDDEEQAYWEKIKNDRKEKFEKKIRCSTRGKNKLIKKMEALVTTHIRFPD